jgi:hypothetical protein
MGEDQRLLAKGQPQRPSSFLSAQPPLSLIYQMDRWVIQVSKPFL